MVRQVVVEVRPGEGGDDAVVFATELVDSFVAYARRAGCDVSTETGRTFTITIKGSPVAGLRLDRFAGTHRVQRIPKNDRAGRRHTSTATVAVLDTEPTRSTVLDRADVDITVFVGSGPGGQHRNRTASCVRATHRPTGLRVVATRHKSQGQNLDDAYREIERRLIESAQADEATVRNGKRRHQIASGERPVKQWTWSDQRGTVTDHSTALTYRMKDFRRGRLG